MKKTKNTEARNRASQQEAPTLTGQLQVNPSGYGFVRVGEGEEDIFVPMRDLATALDGDRVEVETRPSNRGVEGRVVRIVARGRMKLTGTLVRRNNQAMLDPDDTRVPGPVAIEGSPGSAREGQAVLAEIVKYPTAVGDRMCARVLKVLGKPGDPETEVQKIILGAGIPTEFPPEVVRLAKQTPTQVRPEDLADRVDLRDREFVTCDPETARDFDDAVCVEERQGGWRLWVAIADVSHYVPVGSDLDLEARARGCSVYLPDRAIPMLPESLSAGICSLLPEVDRLAMVARLDLGPDASVQGAMFCAAVIRSRARLDYAGVAAALTGDFKGARARYRPYRAHLERLFRLAERLRAQRLARGGLELSIDQAKVLLDEDDASRVRTVARSKPTEEIRLAYGMIEDFMLAANEAVARQLQERGMDTLWRVHDRPTEEKTRGFAELARSYGFRLTDKDAADLRILQKVARELRGKPFERALSLLLLRSLKQATYDVVNIGHFGLGASEYLHFTSPIRRYPDLIVHRQLKRLLAEDGLPSGGHREPPTAREELAAMAAEATAHERRAMEVEWAVVDLYRALLMREHVGDEYEGTISGVTSFGIFVELDDPFVEGLVRIGDLADEFLEYDAERMRLVGRKSGRSFSLGDRVRVRIENVSVERRRIDFALVDEGAGKKREKGRGRSGRGGRRNKRPSA